MTFFYSRILPGSPLSPFTLETTISKLQAAEAAWNTRNLKQVARAYTENRIDVTFGYEWHDASGNWFRSYGNELWEFADNGLMQRRIASINDAPIAAEQRRL